MKSSFLKKSGNGQATRLSDFALDVQKGLEASPKKLSSKYFYDEKGSQIFQQIMGLEEYYLTNCEYEILSKSKNEILRIIQSKNQPFEMIEFGAGDGLKTKVLLQHFLEEKADFTYLPIDISDSALKGLVTDLLYFFPDLKTEGICADYFKALQKLQMENPSRKVLLFLGSNIGNFQYEAALQFLKQIKENLCSGDFLLIGFDLKKNPAVILNAYNDKSGVTREFNLNLLRRINRELEADFDISKFNHFPLYHPYTGCAKSYLVSTIEQKIFIGALNKSFDFEAWEPIHTEVSFKYSIKQITTMAEESGFEVLQNFFDSRNYFTDSLWRVG